MCNTFTTTAGGQGMVATVGKITVRVRCSGKTLRGSRCSRMVLLVNPVCHDRGARCWQHNKEPR